MSGNEVKQLTDARTGALIRVSPAQALTPPDLKTVKRVDAVAGKNPAAANLRDHPEFSGMEFYVTDAKFGTGDISGRSTAFVVMLGYLVKAGDKPKEDNLVTIITGADNVYARIAQAYVKEAFPIVGTLRKSGRAWFLD